MAEVDPTPRAFRGPWMWIATFGGAGLSPRAPGTVGTAASLVLWAPLVLLDTAWWIRLAVAAGLFLVGVVASNRAVAVGGREDPQHVVIDEVVGMGLTLVVAGPQVAAVLAGFGLFRLFDIVKPWPVSWADRRIGGGLGVMVDDVLAGLYALGCLTLLSRYVLGGLP